jgi:hypothetical protein
MGLNKNCVYVLVFRRAITAEDSDYTSYIADGRGHRSGVLLGYKVYCEKITHRALVK